MWDIEELYGEIKRDRYFPLINKERSLLTDFAMMGELNLSQKEQGLIYVQPVLQKTARSIPKYERDYR